MRIIILHIFLLCTCILNAQDPFVTLEVNPTTDVEVGNPIEITIKANVDGNLQFDLPDEFKQSGGAHSGMSSSVNYINGQRVFERYNFQKFQGYLTKAGTYQFGPVVLESRNGNLTSKMVTVKVIEKTEMLSANPSENMDNAVFGIIQQSKKEVYVGEPFVVDAKVFAQIEVIQVDNYSSFGFAGPSEKFTLDKSSQTTRSFEVINGVDVMTFNLGKTVFFPESHGSFELSPFEMLVFYEHPRRLFPERMKISSNSSTIRVKPLPTGAPNSFVGAVGKFGLTAKLNKNKTKQGKVVTLDVTVSGEGNLQNIECPKLDLPSGVILYGDPEIKDAIKYTTKGAVGNKTFTFNLQVNGDKSIEFNPIKISYFNPNSEKYVEVSTQPGSLEVTPNKSYTPIVTNNEEKPEIVREVSQPFLITKSTKKPNTNLFSGFSNLLLGSPILLSILFGFFFRAKHERAKKEANSRKERDVTEQFQRTLTEFKNKTNYDPADYIKLNKALIAFLSVQFGSNLSALSRNELKEKAQLNSLDLSQLNAILYVMDYTDQLKFGVGNDANTEGTMWIDKLEELPVALNKKV